MAAVLIRPYRGQDEPALLDVWNRTLTHDPVDAAAFRTRVLLDLNFRPEGLLVAEVDNRIAGFLLSITRQVPLFLQGLEPEKAWITAFGVHPDYRRRGIATQLFEAALANLKPRQVLISPYTPNYFIPGVDINAYPEAVAFLQAAGWDTVSTPISMQADLTAFQVPAAITELQARLAKEQDIHISPVASADIPGLMDFICRHFGWDWVRAAQEYLLTLFGTGSDEITFLVARQGERIVGYCQQRRERFGPFGVDPALRSQGIGRVLLFHCLAAQRARGFHCAWFLWTGPDASRLYSTAGFRPVRQFAIMRFNNTQPD
ncbi:MAG: GNAT family N-acetyltransferase [Chloroflexi bacterium]|jgi:mycothiol synthase|nr:GNAT family N-acetyltransferase [Chloroflexota bacterium]